MKLFFFDILEWYFGLLNFIQQVVFRVSVRNMYSEFSRSGHVYAEKKNGTIKCKKEKIWQKPKPLIEMK